MGGSSRGQQIQSPGNVTNCPESQFFLNQVGGGVGWGGSFRGQQIKSPGNVVMNCQKINKNKFKPRWGGGGGGVGWGGSFRGQRFMD